MQDLIRALGSWTDGDGPRYIRLAGALKAAIESGELAPRSQLPPERALARSLGVSRNTATAAYELLRSQDLIVSRQGSGTFVRAASGRRWQRDGHHAPDASLKGESASSDRGSWPGGTIEFLAAAFPADALLTPEILSAADHETSRAADAHGYVMLGLPALRTAIAEHLTESGVDTSADQILVTSGAQAAIFLSALMLVASGDTVLIEDPTWLGAIGAYRAAGAEVVGIPSGHDGIDVAACRDLIVRRKPALVHVSPSFNNPTGLATGERSRRELARMLKAADVPLVEDNTLADLGFSPVRMAPIAERSPGGLVLSIGSTSKLFWGGLRVGWIRAPTVMVDRLAQLKLVVDYCTSLPGQALALTLFAHVEAIRSSRRQQAALQLGVLETELRRRLPEWRWRVPDGGLSLWVQLPRGLSLEFSQVAQRHGVMLTPGSLASPGGGHVDRIRLPFVHQPDVLIEGVRRLQAAWTGYDESLPPRSVRHVIV
jgi:DNA-binding transcriptional MocR family regulator